MFHCNLWMVSNFGKKLGYEPISGEEYREFDGNEVALLRDIRGYINECFGSIGVQSYEMLSTIRDFGIMTSFSYVRNHGDEAIDLYLSAFQRFVTKVPATYGVCYLFDSDAGSFEGRPFVIKIVKGRIFSGRDPFFDQYLPVSE